MTGVPGSSTATETPTDENVEETVELPTPRPAAEEVAPDPDDSPAEPAGTDPGPPPPVRTGSTRAVVPARRSRLDLGLLVLTWVVVALGTALRVRQWLAARSFWADEAGLWAVIHNLGYGDLARPLPSGQAAPIGWLWSEHLVMTVLGDTERPARLLPLAFGCGALVLVALLARRLFGGLAALAATFLAAWSPLLVYYSNEFKQYSSDVFFALLLLLAGAILYDRTRLTWRAAAVFGAVATVSVWFSHAAVLTGAGVFAALGLVALATRQWRRLLLLVAAAVPFVVSVAVDYAVALSKTVDNDTLQTFWAGGFPPEPLETGTFFGWVGDNFPRLMDRPLALPAQWQWLVLTLLAAGAVTIAVRRRGQLLVLLMPLVVLHAAASLHSYPVADRLALFAVPTVLILLAAPVDLLAAYRFRTLTALSVLPAAAAVAGLVALATPSVQDAVTYAKAPLEKEETRPVLQYVSDRFRPGDLVLFDTFSLPLSVYSERVGLPADSAMVVRAPRRTCKPGVADALIDRNYRRVWLAWGHTFTGLPYYNRDGYRAHLEVLGAKVDSFAATGAGVELYDLTVPPTDPDRTNPLLKAAGSRCLEIR